MILLQSDSWFLPVVPLGRLRNGRKFLGFERLHGSLLRQELRDTLIGVWEHDVVAQSRRSGLLATNDYLDTSIVFIFSCMNRLLCHQ